MDRRRTRRSSIWPAACCCPGSRTPTSIRRQRPRHAPVRPARRSTRWPTTGESSRTTPTPIPDAPWILGGGWSMDVFPGGLPDEGGARCGGARPSRLPAQPRRPRRVGELPGAGARRDHARDAGSGRRADRARRRWRARRGRCTRVRCAGRSARAGRRRRRCAEGLRIAQRTCTRWASPRGRTRSSTTTTWVPHFDATWPRRRAASSPPASSGRCGGIAIAGSSRSRSSSSCASAGTRRPLPARRA